MFEREKLSFIINIKVLKDEYFCQLKNQESGEVREFTEKSLLSFARRIAWILVFDTCLDYGRLEEKLTRERIRTFIRNRHQEEIFYLSNNYEPISVGVFITYEIESDDASPVAQSNTIENDTGKAPKQGGVFTW